MKKIRNSLTELMEKSGNDLLNIYCTAGFPNLNDTAHVIRSLESAGVDMIEIGIPFSDPLADGPTIQQSNIAAIDNGMNLQLLLNQLQNVKFNVPIILMGYFNPILQFGVEQFCARCQKVGVSGLIIPDLPPSYYESQYKSIFKQHDLSFICLVTPQTDNKRIREIDSISNGFIYAVSSSSTTGTKRGPGDAINYLQKLREMNLENPIMTGFNIRDKESFKLATEYTRGGIIGSAFIKAISNAEDLEAAILSFVKSIKS